MKCIGDFSESALQRLSSLKLSPVFNLRMNSMSAISLFELFAGSTGGYEARKTFGKMRHNEDALAHWHLSLLPYLDCLFHIMYPLLVLLQQFRILLHMRSSVLAV